MVYVKSYFPFELEFKERVAFVEGKRTTLVAVLLPRKAYKRSLMHVGKRNIVPITEEQRDRLEGEPFFRKLLAKGKDGGYVYMDDIPEHQRTADERLKAEKTKNAALQAELDRLRGETA